MIFFSGLLNERKNSNFFKTAVEGRDDRNYRGFTFKEGLVFEATFFYVDTVKLRAVNRSTIQGFSDYLLMGNLINSLEILECAKY